MKKILLIFIIAPFIGFGQSLMVGGKTLKSMTFAELKSAVLLAKTVNNVIFLPQQEISIPDNDSIVIDFNCHIVGGTFRTIDTTGPSFRVFVIKNNSKLICDNLKIIGPVWGGHTINSSLTNAFFLDSGGSLTLNNCTIIGDWNNTIAKTSTGDSPLKESILEINNSTISCMSQCITFFAADGNKKNRIYLNNVKFLRSGLTAAETGTQAYGHTIYLHPNVSGNIEGCTFYKTERNCINYFSQSSITTFENVLLTVTNNTFSDSTSAGFYTNTGGRVVLSGNKFNGIGGIRVENGDFVITDNIFSGISTSPYFSPVGVLNSVVFANNTVMPRLNCSILIDASYSGSYVFAGNIIKYNSLTITAGFNLNAASGVFVLRNNLFICTPLYGINANAGLFSIKDNVYQGPSQNVQYNAGAVIYTDDGN